MMTATTTITTTSPDAHEHICPDCGHYFECNAHPCHDFHKSCEPCVESDAFDASQIDVTGLDEVLARLA